MDGFHENPNHDLYFISYAHQGGFGYVTGTATIRDGVDLDRVCEDIQRARGLRDVVILNFRRFDSD